MMASGPDGRAISDGRRRTNGVTALRSGSRLPATTVLGRKYLNGMDNGLPRLEEP